MSAPTLNKSLTDPMLQEDYRTTAFRAIEKVLRADPVLNRVVKRWRSRTGVAAIDLQPPSFDQCPMIGISPYPRPNLVDTEISMTVNFAVVVEVFVAGTCVDDALNLWGAVENAMIDSKASGVIEGKTVQDYFCNLFASPSGNPHGLFKVRCYEPGFSDLDIKKNNNDPTMQSGRGVIACKIRRPV